MPIINEFIELETEKTRNRLTTRTVKVFNDVNEIDPGWIGVKSLIRVERTGTRGSKTDYEIVCYISSLTLTAQEFAYGVNARRRIRETLEKLSAQKVDPQTLVESGEDDEGKIATRKWTDEEIAEALQVHRNSVGLIRSRFLQKGEKPALDRDKRKNPPTPAVVDGSTEAQIIALCCSEPPDGRADWTIRLLTSELKRRMIVTEISRETV